MLRLPTNGYPNDLLHKITGIPSIAALLNEKIVERLLMLHKALQNLENPEEKRLIRHNIEIMSRKQILKLGLTPESSYYEIKLKKLEMTSRFWTQIDSRLSTFPQRKFEANTYGGTDTILSRSITAKETL